MERSSKGTNLSYHEPTYLQDRYDPLQILWTSINDSFFFFFSEINIG